MVKLIVYIYFFYFSWKHLGESLLAMYRHQTTCEPPRPSLGRRIDLSEYRDPNLFQNLPQPKSPVSTSQTTVLSSSPSSSLPPITVLEPVLQLQTSSQLHIIPTLTTVEVTSTVAPIACKFILRKFSYLHFYSTCVDPIYLQLRQWRFRFQKR